MSITFYATISATRDTPQYMDSGVAYMCPASSWYRVGMKTPRVPAGSRVAADCGGFVASRIWGDYRYTPAEYVAWLDSFSPEWAATMDWCCEDEITSGKPGIVRERQERTTETAYEFYRDYRHNPCTWVCTVQGWQVEDYTRHAQQLKPLLKDWRRHYGDNPMWRAGIGTLCARASTSMIQRVIDTVRTELPDTPLHLWGVKLAALKSRVELRNVVSVDSAAWDAGGLGRDGVAAMHDRKERGISQREYAYTVSLPRYLAKVQAAVDAPKQRVLF